MNLSKLIHKLKNSSFTWASNTNSNEEIYNCLILDENNVPKPNYLYLCTPKTLSKDFDSMGYNFLCLISAPDEQLSYRFHNANLIYVTAPGTLMALKEQVDFIISDYNVLSGNMYKLMQVIHSNFGIQALIDTAYEILQNPILLVDSSYKILASCQNVVYNRPDLETQKELGYIVESNILAMKQAKLYERAREKRYPYYNKEKDAKEGWITALVYIYGIESAHIAVNDSNRPFTDNDFEFVDFLCKLVSLELQKSDFYRTNESLMHSFFLSELLDNHMRDMPTILRRAQSLNWNLTEYLRVLTITEQTMNIFDKKAQLIANQLHKILPNSHWIIYEGHIVFLVCLADPSAAALVKENTLVDFLKINKLAGSVSRCFHSLIDTRRFYQESLAAYQFGQRFHPEDSLHFYTDYLCQHIGGILAEQYPLSSFYHPGVIKMKEYDALHNTNLLITLKEYLTYPDTPAVAAQNLFIHKNTLFYRMAKIKELFTLDLSDGEERLKIHLTLKFMELE
ncbi:PucR family transcriptional regulator [Konateibacter massiliensis]|uniref:PucR family transcriptional regulator n=1 Tax=Konateibacter massiliensis TaxID=2002841 RepID=UPI0015D5219F|nr:PucR family transcriptional regulator [Konateibacter massiliensis]